MIKLRNFNKFLKVPNNLNKITILILILFSSTILSLFLWEHINIPVDKSLEYGGDYYDKSYNKNNDTLRFIVFITLSILPFLVSYIFLFKENNTKISQFLQRIKFKYLIVLKILIRFSKIKLIIQ